MKSNSKIKSTVLVSALVLSIGSLQAAAMGAADDIDQTTYTTAFKSLDTNNDGKLSKDEVINEKPFAKNFATADKNHDGTLDQEEFTSYKSKAEQKEVKRIASDSLITSKVKAKMLGDEGLKSLKVSVETHRGIVLLSGFVTTEDQIKQAVKIATDTEGVKSVKNSLVLKKD
jgi:hyperosmotically inducible protein